MSQPIVSRKTFLGGAAVGAGEMLRQEGANPPRRPVTVLARNLPADTITRIEAASPGKVKLVVGPPDWGAALADADALFGGFTAEDIRQGKNLRWIQYGAAGVEKVLFPELVASPIVLTNGKGCYGPAIAEHVFGLLFALTRSIAPSIRAGNWNIPSGLRRIEQREQTMGIVGFGGIGREVARRAMGMDMRVVACDIEPMQKEQVGNLASAIYPVDGGGLLAMFKECDVVVSCVPHTRKSEGMFGPAQFAAMKPGAHFVNISRGKVTQTPALLAALQSGHLAGAGLDVTDPEPLPEGHPLWKMPNVVITPHISGQSQWTQRRVQSVFIDNVFRFANGLPLVNQVDKVKGY